MSGGLSDRAASATAARLALASVLAAGCALDTRARVLWRDEPDAAVDGDALPAPEPNLYVNPGFETASLEPWHAIDSTLADAAGMTGRYGAVLGTNGAVSQDLAPSLRPGVRYRFTAWVRVLEPTAEDWGGPRMAVDVYRDLGAARYGFVMGQNATAAGWQQLSFERAFSAAELRAPVHCGVRMWGPTNGRVAVDDLRAVAAPP